MSIDKKDHHGLLPIDYKVLPMALVSVAMIIFAGAIGEMGGAGVLWTVLAEVVSLAPVVAVVLWSDHQHGLIDKSVGR